MLIYNNAAGPAPTNLTIANPDGTAFPQPALITSQAVGQELAALAAAGPVTVEMEAKLFTEFRSTTNLWAETSGDPDRTVVVGAHLDSVPAGPGINDNGSGSGGILEIAEQYASRGLEPRNRIRFMWFGAEERGLLGSNYYVDHLTEAEKDQILVNLNFDMIGSPNGARLVYDGDNSAFPVGPGALEGPEGSGLIEGVFASYFRNQGLSYAPTAFSGRSDYGRFIANGIPAGGLFTGAEGPCTARYGELFGCTVGVPLDPCYHQACDTLANVKLSLLHEMADAAAHATYTFGLTKAAIVDEGVLRPGTSTPDTEADTAAGTGDGGLHPLDDEEELLDS